MTGWLAVAFLGLVVAARTRLTMTVASLPVSVPVLLVAAVILVLALAAVILVLARLLVRDGLRLRPRVVTTA